jgi:hypothetical protein
MLFSNNSIHYPKEDETNLSYQTKTEKITMLQIIAIKNFL